MVTLEPNVFLVGAPKCGTTALASYLAQHPKAVVSDPKEPLYFCHDYPKIQKFKAYDHYLSAFNYNHGKSPSVTVDASIWYLYSEEALAAIQQHNPGAKIIIGVREPTAFMYSLYKQQRFGGHEDQKTFREAWELRLRRRQGEAIPPKCQQPELIDYEKLALFSTYVKKWLDAFGEKNVFVYSQEELKVNPESLYATLLDFLALEHRQPDSWATVNPAKQHRFAFMAKLLHSSFFRSGWHRPIKQALGIRSFGVYAFLTKLNLTVSKQDKEDLTDLRDNFKEEEKALFALVGRELW